MANAPFYAFDEDSAGRIKRAVRSVLGEPVLRADGRQSRRWGYDTFSAKVTAIGSSSNAPPLTYTIQRGHWDLSGGVPGAWVDDSGGASLTGYGEDPAMIPAPVNTIVTARLRSVAAGVGYFTISGSVGPFCVYLTQNGGSDGVASSLTFATWTYDVFIDAAKTVKIATAASVVRPRFAPVTTTPATRGIAQMQGGGTGAATVTLLDAFESYAFCSS